MSKFKRFKRFLRRKIRAHPNLHFVYLLVRNTISGFGRDGGYHLAAGIAFFALFSLFPLLLVFISIIGFKIGTPEAIQQIHIFLNKIFPAKSSLIMDNIQIIAKDKSKLGLVGILILFWCGRGLFLALEYSLNRIWGTPSGRSVLGRNALAFFLIFVGGLILGFSMVLSAFIAFITNVRVPIINFSLSRLTFWGTLNNWILSTLLIFVIFLLLYKILPHSKVTLKEILPGALFSTVCWKIAEFAYIFYMSNMAKFSEIYGSIGGLLGLLFWFYIGSIVFILGVEFNLVFLRLKGYKKTKNGRNYI